MELIFDLELENTIEGLKLELKNNKKILEQEIGETGTDGILGTGWKGRNQQIIALQSRLKELEKIARNNNNLNEVKILRKNLKDFQEKYKNDINEKMEAISDVNKKDSF